MKPFLITLSVALSWVSVTLAENALLKHVVTPAILSDTEAQQATASDVVMHPELYQTDERPICKSHSAWAYYSYQICVSRLLPAPEGVLYRQVVWIKFPIAYSLRVLGFSEGAMLENTSLIAYISDSGEAVY